MEGVYTNGAPNKCWHSVTTDGGPNVAATLPSAKSDFCILKISFVTGLVFVEFFSVNFIHTIYA